MKGSKYENDMLVSAEHLNYTEDTKSDAITERMKSSINPGIDWGLGINQINSNTIEVQEGVGYTKSGNRIYVENTNKPQLSFSAPGDANKTYFIILRYKTEPILGTEAPKYGGGYTAPIKQKDSFQIEKSETYPSNISGLENTICIGLVRLDSNAFIVEIIGLESFTLGISIEQPIYSPNAISGIWITAINFPNLPENGSLSRIKLDYDVNSGYSISWKKETGGSYGTPVNITGSGLYIINDSNTNYNITVYVVMELLPNSGFPLEKDLQVFKVYDRITRKRSQFFSPEDRLHRDLVGSQILHDKNPHGIGLNDLGGFKDILSEVISHRSGLHTNGLVGPEPIVRNQLMPSLINTPQEALRIADLNDVNSYVVIDGEKIINVPQTDIVFGNVPGDNYTYLIEVGLTKKKTLIQSQRFKYYKDNNNFNSIFILDTSDDIPVGTSGVLYYTMADGIALDLQGTGNFRFVKLTSGVPKRFYLLDTGTNYWMDCYYNGGVLPNNATSTPVVFLNDSLMKDKDVFSITNILWRGNDGSLFYNDLNQKIVDKRRFGTIGIENIGSDLLERLTFLRDLRFAETRSDGVIVGFGYLSGQGTGTLNLEGGQCYINGRKVKKEQKTSITGFGNNKTYIIYIDEDGNIDKKENVAEVSATGKRVLPLIRITTNSAGQISSWTDIRKGVGLISDLPLRQEGVPIDVPPIRNLVTVSNVVGEDKCQAKWGDKDVDKGFGRIILGQYTVYLTKNLRWDGTQWYKDVENHTATAIMFRVDSTTDDDEFVKFYRVPATVSSPFDLQQYRTIMFYTPKTNGAANIRFGKDWNGNNITDVYLYNPFTGGLVNLYLWDLVANSVYVSSYIQDQDGNKLARWKIVYLGAATFNSIGDKVKFSVHSYITGGFDVIIPFVQASLAVSGVAMFQTFFRNAGGANEEVAFQRISDLWGGTESSNVSANLYVLLLEFY